MSEPMDDPRRSPRVNVDLQASVRTPDGRKMPARTRDISRSGVCLITSAPLHRGDELQIELVLLIGPSSFSEPLPLRARVVWCTAIARAFQVGAMFSALNSRESAFLDMFLRFLDGTILPGGAPTGGSSDDLPEISVDDDVDDPFRP
jgi:hypothetical protein